MSDTQPPPRLQCLDAYRGFIMLSLLAGGIFSTLKGHPQLHWLWYQTEHLPWEGCTFWDLIQPSFMFMVGVAMPFAAARRAELGESAGRRTWHAFRRALNLMLIGIALDHFGRDTIQIGYIRVLQQIAIGYLIAWPFVGRGWRVQTLAAAAILIAYQVVWTFNPWNGPGGPWAMGYENVGGAFDRWLLARNYPGYYVTLNAIPSTATILFGVIAGGIIQHSRDQRRTLLTLCACGVGAIALGVLLGIWFPLIKRIWTPSFAIYAGGITTLILAAFYWLVEIAGQRRAVFPLVVVGMNSIAAYVLSGCFAGWFRSLSTAWLAWAKKPLGEVWHPVFAKAVWVIAAWGILYWLWRRRIFFKA